MNTKTITVTAIAIGVLILTGCSGGGQAEAARTANVVAVPTAGPGSDIYASALPTDAGVDQAPSKSSAAPTVDAGADNPTCDMVAETLLEYSAAAADEDTAAIDRVIEAKLVFADPDTETLPAAGDKRVLIQCDARVHWDAGYKSDLQYYLLLDSDGDLRVRWDGIENVEEG
jgi:hypothetical protein